MYSNATAKKDKDKQIVVMFQVGTRCTFVRRRVSIESWCAAPRGLLPIRNEQHVIGIRGYGRPSQHSQQFEVVIRVPDAASNSKRMAAAGAGITGKRLQEPVLARHALFGVSLTW